MPKKSAQHNYPQHHDAAPVSAADADKKRAAYMLRKPLPIFPVEGGDDVSPTPVSIARNAATLLPTNYRLSKYDVINGRGRKSYNHIGNRRFRQLAAMNLKRYAEARTKMDKTLVVISIVDAIRDASPYGGFLKRDAKTQRWISIGDMEAREKVGHCLRDMIASTKEDPRIRKAGQIESIINSVNMSTAANVASKLPTLAHMNAVAAQAAAAQAQVQQAVSHTTSRATPSSRHPLAAAAHAAAAAAHAVPSRSPSTTNTNNGHHHHHRHHHSKNGNNFKQSSSKIRSSTIEMSAEQKMIIRKLENGFKGTVAELLGKKRQTASN